MFIEIDRSILCSPDVLSKYKYKIMSLIETHFRGEHYLFFQRKAEYVDNLKTLFREDAFHLKILDKIVDDLTEFGGLYKNREMKCIIVEYVMHYHNNQNTIYIPISKLETPIVETRLLGENLTDAKFYEELTNLFISRKNEIYQGKIKCETVGGGGATTSKTLSEIASKRKYFCLCITDSDFDGNRVTSDTSKDVERFCTSNQGSFSHFKLPCRELENLIPPEYYKRVLSGDDITKIDKLIPLSCRDQKIYDYKANFGDKIFERYYNGDYTRNSGRFYQELPEDYINDHKILIKKIVDWCCAPNSSNYIV
ncbi:TPA: hypothetical protein ACGO0I_001316 [Streptococcus suis]